MTVEFTNHALEEIRIRDIDKQIIEAIIQNPKQILDSENNRKVYQDIVEFKNKKQYVVRVIIEETKGALRVVTAYKSSKISKYWR
ncbi:MAG TPA: DUF4258 domain-containing protein [Ignavibacteria bacterium]|jgi:hypothetical protein|nr:DUF4258 domain-containing protein [Ignavibacteria bacterium]